MKMVEVMFRHYRAIKYELVGRRNFYSAGGEFGTPYPIGCGKEEHSAEKQTFPLKDENTGNTVYCTIENYFKNQYGKNIKFPKLNCVQVSPAERNVFIPFE
ncbi:argonaute 4-like, partial [Homarus americanus]